MIYHNGFSHWLSAGIICLLVGGTLAAKTVFLVDNELESKTEFSGENWQLNPESVQKYTNNIEKLAYQYIDRLTQLPDRQAWCGSASEISMVLAKAKSLNLIELNNLAAGKADIIVKIPTNKVIQTDRRLIPNKNLHLYINPTLQSDRSVESWCIAAGI
jgi:hypothetical protein